MPLEYKLWYTLHLHISLLAKSCVGWIESDKFYVAWPVYTILMVESAVVFSAVIELIVENAAVFYFHLLYSISKFSFSLSSWVVTWFAHKNGTLTELVVPS